MVIMSDMAAWGEEHGHMVWGTVLSSRRSFQAPSPNLNRCYDPDLIMTLTLV